MAKRDKSGPPRPSAARPTAGPRPRPSDRPSDRPPDRPRVPEAVRRQMEDTKDSEAEVVQPRSSDDLDMIPVSEEGEHEDLAPPPPPGATQFFAVDKPKPFVEQTEATRRDKEISQRAALFTPDRDRRPEDPIVPARPVAAAPSAPPPGAPASPPGASVPSALQPGASPPPRATTPPAAAPGIAGPVAGVPLGIRGPIASGPGNPAPSPATPSRPGPEDPADRTTSYRIYVVMLALMSLVALSVIVAFGVIAAVVMLSPDDTEAPVATAPPPVPQPVAPAPPPVILPAPEIAVEPPAEPVPVKPTAGTVTIRLAPGSPRFVSLRIDCEDPPFRERKRFDAGVVTVPGVPRASCVASFLGGLPARTMVRGGDDKTCSFEGSNAICR